MSPSTELYSWSTYRKDPEKWNGSHLLFSVALGNKYMQEQGLPWLLEGYLAADGERKSQTRREGHPQLKTARVVRRSIKLSGWKEYSRMKGKLAQG